MAMEIDGTKTAVAVGNGADGNSASAALNVGKTCFLNEGEKENVIAYLNKRLSDGHGETLFCVGHSDTEEPGLTEDELIASCEKLAEYATTLEAVCTEMKRQKLHSGRFMAYVLIRRDFSEDDFLEVRVAVVGNVDAGKSTLLGVLTHCQLDNGRGSARKKLFRHKHEQDTGRTSSVGNDILGFDSSGRVINDATHGQLDWARICRLSAKVVTFIDLAGHEKYLKTTVFGMTGHQPDFTMLMVGANAGVVGMCKEHLGLALALSVPVFVVITKIDMSPENVLQDTIKVLQKLLKSPGCRKLPVIVQNVDDVIISAMNFTTERVCPIFLISNVTGHNLDLLRLFLNLLNSRMICNETDPAEFRIDDSFAVPGVGTVVSGIALKGTVKLNDLLLLGPDALGEYVPAAIKGIHRKRLNVSLVKAGQTASFALKKIRRNQIRKGMVMVSASLHPKAYWEFKGEVLVLHHPTTMKTRYQAVVHVGGVRQTATIIAMTKDYLRTGDKATVHFRFMKYPEYVTIGTKFVFREGRTKAIGCVTDVLQGRAHISDKGQKKRQESSNDSATNPGPSNGTSGSSRRKKKKPHAFKFSPGGSTSTAANGG